MKNITSDSVTPGGSRASNPANFNGGEHLRVEIEEGANQTISCKLPNGKFVTFAFCPSSTPGEMECVDIHTNSGPAVPRAKGDGGPVGFLQHLVGFTYGSNTFATKQLPKPTTLATLLLSARHYDQKP